MRNANVIRPKHGVNYYTIVLIILAFLALAVALFFCNIDIEQPSIKEVRKTIYADDITNIELYNCSMTVDTDGVLSYLPDGSDAKIKIPCTDDEINCVKVNLAAPLNEQTLFQLFYTKSGEEPSDMNVSSVLTNNDTDNVVLFVPQGVYSELGLKINKACSIETVELCVFPAGVTISAKEFSSFQMYNCHIENDSAGNEVFVPDNEDPMVYLPLNGDRIINCVRLNFAVPLAKDTMAQVFYGESAESLLSENSVIYTLSGGITTAYIYIPQGMYSMLRLDINGIYSIKDVELCIGQSIETYKTITADEFNSLSPVNYHLDNTDSGDMLYVPDNSDPQIYLPTVNEEINCVEIQLNYPLDRDVMAQIFYAKANEKITGENTTTSVFPKGHSTLAIPMPNGVYPSLRLDLNGTCSVKSINLCNIKRNRSYGENFKVCKTAIQRVTNTQLVLNGNSTQLYFTGTSGNIDSIVMDFTEPLAKDTLFEPDFKDYEQEAYNNNNGSTMLISDTDSTIFESGTESVMLNIPKESYDKLRLNIDGICSIKTIQIGTANNNVYQSNLMVFIFMFWGTIILSVIILFVFLKSKKTIICFVVGVSVLSVVSGILGEQVIVALENNSLSRFRIQNEDGALFISWIPPSDMLTDSLNLTIMQDENIILDEKLSPVQNKYIFKEGKHGEGYSIHMAANYKNGKIEYTKEKRAVFLDFDKLPQYPTISINTATGDSPLFDVMIKLNGIGSTAVNNEYINGNIIMNEPVSISTSGKIRVRGNTSATVNKDGKMPYKIQLDNPVDLLGRGNEFADRDWYLLNISSMKSLMCNYIAELCGSEWQPQMRFVNLILNGQWQGLYILSEAISVGFKRCNISETGILYESDPYWWSLENGVFNTQAPSISEFPYSLKYPEILNESVKIQQIQEYVNKVESILISGSDDIFEYIDMNSFVNWLIAHDIIRVADTAGSNHYYYKYDFNISELTSSKIKMGPLWDFDSARFASDGRFSNFHLLEFFPWLTKHKEFNDAYQERWEEISPTLVENVKKYLNEVCEEYGDELDNSLRLNNALWGGSVSASFYSEKDQLMQLLSNRMENLGHVINTELNEEALNVQS